LLCAQQSAVASDRNAVVRCIKQNNLHTLANIANHLAAIHTLLLAPGRVCVYAREVQKNWLRLRLVHLPRTTVVQTKVVVIPRTNKKIGRFLSLYLNRFPSIN
jgi:hypothetical protein